MVIIGLWVAITGYTVLYAGVQKLNGDPGCTLGNALRGRCGKAAPGGTSTTTAAAQTGQSSSGVPQSGVPATSGISGQATGQGIL